MTEQIVIRSADRVSGGTSSAFNFELDEPLPAGYYFINSLQMTVGCYNVNSNNNKIYFYENSTAKTATITAGNYTTDSLPAAVKTAMDTASAAFNTFTVVSSELTGKLTITASNNFKFMFATNTTNSAARALGYSTDGTLATSQVGDMCIDLAYPQNLFIDIDHCNGTVRVRNRTYCLMVPITAGFQSVITQNSRDYQTKFKLKRGLKNLRIDVYDDDGKAVDLNGYNWTLTLLACFD